MIRTTYLLAGALIAAWILLSMLCPCDSDAQGPKGVGATYTLADNYEVCEATRRVGATWMYNWFEAPTLCEDVESVPMIKDFDWVGRELGGNSPWLLGPNEPDCIFQSFATPQEGAVGWRALEAAYPDKLLVSPAVMKLQWLKWWYETYMNTYGALPRVDALAFHCYVWADVENSLAHCKSQTMEAIWIANEWGGIPVWLTEWSYLGPSVSAYNDADAVEYMQRMRMWLERQPRVDRYAYFELAVIGNEPWLIAGLDTSLVDYHTGETTALGIAYSRDIYVTYLPTVRRNG